MSGVPRPNRLTPLVPYETLFRMSEPTKGEVAFRAVYFEDAWCVFSPYMGTYELAEIARRWEEAGLPVKPVEDEALRGDHEAFESWWRMQLTSDPFTQISKYRARQIYLSALHHARKVEEASGDA